MFGNNKPIFGATTTASAFGQPSTTFGMNTTAFGQPQQQQMQPQQSLFGGNNAFGGGSSGMFGATNTAGGGLFGTNTAASTSTFGQPQANTFGSSTSLFGANANQTQQQNNSLFGASRFGATNATVSPFGGTGTLGSPMQQTVGTVVKFVPVTGTDNMLKNGVTANINTRHQCITCMKEYETKSLEELRTEDYQANRKGPQAQTGFGTSGGGLFGSTQPAAMQNNAFGGNTSGGLFGAKPFGQTTPNQPAVNPAGGGLFGNFANKQPTTSLFGNTSTAFPTFQTQTPQTNTLFGAATTNANTMNQSSFFSTNPSANTNTVKPFGFGTTAAPTGGGLFGQTPANTLGAKPLFSTTSAAPSFGTSNTFNTANTGTLFTTSQPSFFNAAGNNNQQQTKPMFSFNSTQPTLQLGSTSLGTSTAPGQGLFGTSNFGTTGGTTSLFGNNSTSNLFGSSTSMPSNNAFQPTGFLQQQPQQSQMFAPQSQTSAGTEQLLSRLQTLPYGESPLFHIDISVINSGKEPTTRTKFTTDPKTLYQYSVNARTSESKPQRIATTNRATSILFDGLEDENNEELKTANDIFVPRKNVKKLVLKPKLSNESDSPSLNETIQTTQTTPTFHAIQPLRVRQSSPNISDTTINDFYQNAPHHSRQTKPKETSLSIEGEKPSFTNNPTFTRLHKLSDSSKSSIQESDEEETNTSPQKDIVVPKCGVILTRSDYYTCPSIDQLDTFYDASTDTCIIDSFTVGRHDYGSIYWEGPLDVKSLNLDEIVHIRRKEVIVYPDDDIKPPQGEGLNRSAQITLHQVWPIDKTTHQVIKDLDRLRSMKYAERIETATLKLDASFKEYRPETGSWVFTVKHFSKYGLMEDDDEEMEETNVEVSKAPPATQPKQPIQVRDARLAEKEKLPFQAPLSTSSMKSVDASFMENAPFDQSSLYLLQGSEFSTTNFFDSTKLVSQLQGFESEEFDEMQDQYDSITHKEKFFEKDTMKSILFDQIEDDETFEDEQFTKKVKFPSILQSEKFSSPYSFFPSVIFPPVELSVPKKRVVNLKPDFSGAKAKNVRDINSVCVSQSPRIGFFQGSKGFTLINGSSVLILDLKLIQSQPDLLSNRFDEQLQKNSLIVNCSRPNTIVAPFIETRTFSRNSQNPSDLEDLIKAMFSPLSEITEYARTQERLTLIKTWLFNRNKKIPIGGKITDKIIHYLATNELEKACSESLLTNQPRLAQLIACGTNVNQQLLKDQLNNWKDCDAVKLIDKGILTIYILLSGDIIWERSNTEMMNILDGLVWTQQLALMLLYATPPESHSDNGKTILEAYIDQLIGIPNQVEYHLLANHSPWVSMSYSSDILESWFLHESLRAYSMIEEEDELCSNSDLIHTSVASQLQDLKWACFVVLHIRNETIREMTIKEILNKNASLFEENDELAKWLIDHLLLPNEYIAEAKAFKSKCNFDYSKYALNLLECGKFAEAHDVFMEHVFPELVIIEQYDLLAEILDKLSPNSHLIPNWTTSGAKIYQTYLQCIQDATIETISSFNVHQLSCKHKRHVLSQSEMTRRVNLIYSQLSGGTFAYNTPIPDDYALLELKSNARKLAKLLC